ncbi:MAG: hypothetical protein LUC30_04580 [Clostridiales bacterium]|nr:hypothetical protein [Clostridiales bacterium]
MERYTSLFVFDLGMFPHPGNVQKEADGRLPPAGKTLKNSPRKAAEEAVFRSSK